jgi:hypothetical protein
MKVGSFRRGGIVKAGAVSFASFLILLAALPDLGGDLVREDVEYNIWLAFLDACRADERVTGICVE